MGMAVRALLAGCAVLALAAPAHASADAGGSVPAVAAVAVEPATAAPPPPVRATTTPPCAGLGAHTIDDGPRAGVTRRLVRILQDRHVPATFFMVGSRVHEAPRLARRVAEAGFAVGNHTWSHAELTRLPDAAIRHELRSAARELRRAGVPRSTLRRPPSGALDRRVRADVRDLGLVPVLWTVDSDDWRGGTARQIADSILRQLERHRENIVLQHDGVRNSPASVAAVPRVIRVARQRGYCFGRLGPHGHVLAPRDPGASRTQPATATVVPTAERSPVATPFGTVLDHTGTRLS